MTPKTPKQITKASDLEGIKPMEEVELNPYSLPDKMFYPPRVTGVLGGSFNINNETYFVVTDVKPSMRFSDGFWIRSCIYKAKEKGIDYTNIIFNGHYNKAKPGFNLEETIKEQVSSLKHETLKNLNKNQ